MMAVRLVSVNSATETIANYDVGIHDVNSNGIIGQKVKDMLVS
jgi:hypothetical protein